MKAKQIKPKTKVGSQRRINKGDGWGGGLWSRYQRSAMNRFFRHS